MATASVGPTNVEAAEVPSELLTQLNVLTKAISDNKRLYAECKEISASKELKELEEKAGKVVQLTNQQKSVLKGERIRTAGMAQKIGLDQRIAHNIQRTRENLAKNNPQFGRVHSVDFLHEVAAQNEQALAEQWKTVGKLRELLEQLQKADEQPNLSRHDLVEHLNRFDKIFEQVANQVYTVNDATEKLRDTYLDQRRKYGGPFKYGDPFEKQKERQRVIDAYSSLKGIDAFPSQNAILSLCEYLPKQPTAPAQPQFGTTPFGQPQPSGGLFGAPKPAFSFTPSAQPSTSLSLFGPSKTPTFGATTTTAATIPFGTATTTSAATVSLPLFGSTSSAGATATPVQPQSSAQPIFGFSNTLSSPSSGTLFKATAPAAKSISLFGSK